MPSGGGSPDNLFNLATNVTSALGAVNGGSQYFGTINKLNLDFLIRATESDSRSKVLESPILMTQDNKEASIESTKLAYLYNGMKYIGSSYGSTSSDYQPDIKQEEIGLHITVTPRINPDGTVVLDFEEEFQDATQMQKVPGDESSGAGGEWPVPTTRKISGAIAVKDGQTVVIGGLVKQTKTELEGGIPILRHIPFIGRWLFGYTEYKDNRDELLVFLTPYVFYTSEEAQKEAQRRKNYLDAAGVWNKGWSNSELADTADEQDLLRREKSKNEYEKKQVEARAKRTKAQREHDEEMKELLKKNIDRDKRELEEDRKSLTAEEIEAREAAIRDEELMHEALLREINLDEESAE
jgi:type II secretory pathway component GspD/PulD (secretin)